jgi:TetR/AcrR family transcriptional repressor of mexJK operon
LANAQRAEDFAGGVLKAFDENSDLETAFRKLAREYVAFVIRPEVIRLRRLVIGEAGRFPELARQYYERVPERVYEGLAKLLAQLDDAGKLSIEDPLLAAQHFAWLLLGWPLDRGMFYVDAEPLAGDRLERVAEEAVRVFLAAYS